MPNGSTRLLDRCRILILEDEYFLGEDLKRMLCENGANVIGPIGELSEAHDALIKDGFDTAIMNVNLRDTKAFVLADELRRQRIPFMFATGFGADAIPERFRDVKVRQKPFAAREILQDVAELCRRCAI